jgi:dUTP pyrophosphatase
MQIKLSNLAKELMTNGVKDPTNPEQYASFIPVQGTPASAGFDILACIDEPKKIAFGETLLVPCGFHLHIKDPNLVGKLYVRSSVGTKLGLVLANGTGIVDSDYQDEWMLALKCHRSHSVLAIVKQGAMTMAAAWKTFRGSYYDGDLPNYLIKSLKKYLSSLEDSVTIYPAQRLAQVVFTPVVHPMFNLVESFTESSDRLGGFGSTDGKTYGG